MSDAVAEQSHSPAQTLAPTSIANYILLSYDEKTNELGELSATWQLSLSFNKYKKWLAMRAQRRFVCFWQSAWMFQNKISMVLVEKENIDKQCQMQLVVDQRVLLHEYSIHDIYFFVLQQLISFDQYAFSFLWSYVKQSATKYLIRVRTVLLSNVLESDQFINDYAINIDPICFINANYHFIAFERQIHLQCKNKPYVYNFRQLMIGPMLKTQPDTLNFENYAHAQLFSSACDFLLKQQVNHKPEHTSLLNSETATSKALDNQTILESSDNVNG